MSLYEVDDELAFLVDRLAPRQKPFETISFQEGLRRVIAQYVPKAQPGDVPELVRQVAIANALRTAHSVLKKAPTPSAIEYATSVPELKKQRHLTTWKAICDALDIETLGDSARRKLAAWVRLNKPEWPPVPDPDSEL